VERLAGRMGQWLGDQFQWTSDEREIATFSLLLLISTGFTLVLLVLLGWLAGVLPEVLLMAGTAAVLRTFAGGSHLSSGWRCAWATAGAATIAAYLAHVAGPVIGGWLAGRAPWVLLAIGLGVAVIMARLAPVPAPGKPFRSERHRRVLRVLAVVTTLAWATGWAVGVSRGGVQPSLWLASTLGLLQEALSVTPSGERIARWLDRMLAGSLVKSLMKGGERA